MQSHFIERISETEQLVKKVDIIPLEVVVRNIAAGSFQNDWELKKELALQNQSLNFTYKDDELRRSTITTEDHIDELNIATPEEVAILQEKALQMNEVLSSSFRRAWCYINRF